MTGHNKELRQQDWEGFSRDVMKAWPVGGIDGFELQDMAERHGLIAEIPGGFDPAEHANWDGCFEPGDPVFELTYASASDDKRDEVS